MANINVSSPGQFVQLFISTATITSTTGTGVLAVPALQDVTITNNNGVFRWKQLDNPGQKVAVTPATNSINLQLVVDDTSFYGSGYGNTSTNYLSTAPVQGVFGLSNNKTKVYFQYYWGGSSTNQVSGSGFLSGLAPKVNPDQPVYITPLIIEVDGIYNTGTT